MWSLSRLSVLGLAASVAASAGVVAFMGAAGFAGAANAADAPAEQPSIEEDYEYPNRKKIFDERGIDLIRGDGKILLVDCGSRKDVLVVESRIRPKPAGNFCFHIKGNKGFVEMSLPKAYFIVGDGTHEVTAKVTVGEETEVVEVDKDGHTPIGESSDPQGRPGTLVELRVG